MISALVLNYRNPRATLACVESLLSQSIADRLEIIVVDNHSEDDSIGFLRNRYGQHPQVKTVETRGNLGFGKGYGAGARIAQGTYLLIDNPDKILPPDGLERLVAKAESDPTIGILAPALIHPDGSFRLSPRTFPHPIDVIAKRTFLQHLLSERMARYLQLREHPEQERSVDWIAGGCFLIRRDFFERLRGFDPRFFLFFEDIDLCRRCIEAGKRVVYFPAVRAADKKKRLSEGGALSLLSTRIGRTHIASAVKYFWKWRARA